jgi:hypothetical protein
MERIVGDSQSGGAGGATKDRFGKDSQLQPEFYRQYALHRLNQLRGNKLKGKEVPAAESTLLSQNPFPGLGRVAAPVLSEAEQKRMAAQGRGLSTGDTAILSNWDQYLPDLNNAISREQREAYEPSPEHDRFMQAVDEAMDLPVVPYQRLYEQFGGRPPTEELEALGYTGGDLTPRQYVALMPTFMKQRIVLTADPGEVDAALQGVDDNAEGIVDLVTDGLKARDGLTASSLAVGGGTPAQELVTFATSNLLASIESGEFDGDFADPASMSLRDKELAGIGENQLATEGARKNVQRKVVGDLLRTFQDGRFAPDYAHFVPATIASMHYMDGDQRAVDRMNRTMDPNVFRGRSQIALDKFERNRGRTGDLTTTMPEGRSALDDDFTFNRLVSATHDPSSWLGRNVGQPGMNYLSSVAGIKGDLAARNQASYMYNRAQPLHYDADTQESAADKVLRANQQYRLGPERFNTWFNPAFQQLTETVTGVPVKPNLGTQGSQILPSVLHGLTQNPYAAGTMGLSTAGNFFGRGGNLFSKAAAASGSAAGEVSEELFEELGQQMVEAGSPSDVIKSLSEPKKYSPFIVTPTYDMNQGRDNRALAPMSVKDDLWGTRDEAVEYWDGITKQQERDYQRQFPSEEPSRRGSMVRVTSRGRR